MGGLKKRGQITVFIILGIVILMSSAVYFYFQNEVMTTTPEKVVDRKTTILHPFTESCMDNLARDALSKVGMTGGYIEYPLAIANNPSSYMRIAPIGDAKMPYWWYNGESRIPPIEFIKAQIETYIENNIDSCLNNFSSVYGYEVNKTGDVDVVVDFAEQGTNVRMKYPLTAVKVPNENLFSLNDYNFFVKVPIRFKEVYGVAKKIMEDEDSDYFMESFTMDLISLADTPNGAYPTPLMNMEFNIKPRMWNIKKTSNNVKTLLEANTQYIKFEGTEYVPISNEYPYMQNHTMWRFEDPEITHPGIHVSATYDSKWPMKIEISPTKGGVLKSGSTRISQYLSFIGIQTWHFTYDIVYPTLITITDEAGKNNDEYTFSYAFQVSIQKNRPMRANFGSTVFSMDDRPTDEEQCEYMMSMTNKPVVFSTINEFTGEPVKWANISVSCGKYNCPIGETRYDENNHGMSSSVTGFAPYCGRAIVWAEKEGFETAKKAISIDSDTGMVEIKMRPVKEFSDYEVVKRLYIIEPNPLNSHASSVEEPLNFKKGEKTVIVLRDQYGNEQYVNFPKEKVNETDDETGEKREVDITNPISLYQNKETYYNVTIYFFSEGNDDNTILGGYKGVLNISNTDIVNQNGFVKFTVLEYKTSDDEMLAGFLTNIETYSAKVPSPQLLNKGE